MNAAAAGSLPAVEDAAFTARTTLDGATMDVAMSGTADLVVQTQIEAYLTAIHATAVAAHVSTVRADVRPLEFMNSSCIKALVTWILSAARQPEDCQYRIVFRTSPTTDWQRRSFALLARMSAKLVSIET